MQPTPSGYDRAFIAPDGTPGTPEDANPDAGWIDLGEMFEAQNQDPTATSRNTTMNRPKYANAVIDGSLELTDTASFDSVAALEATGEKVVLAIRKADGKFQRKKNIRVSIRPAGGAGSGQLRTAMLRYYGAKHRIRDLQEAPVAPAA